MTNEKTVEVLNSLIEINNDRIEGYETAQSETEQTDLKTMFAQFVLNSKKFKESLEAEVHSLGGKPIEGTKVSGKFFRVWMEFKAALSGNDRKVILESCEYGEEVAVEIYEKALRDESENTTPEQKNMIETQYKHIKSDHHQIKSLLEMLETN